eukprot:TRINITY_DN3317_c0_g4_i1.p1 TRINITY_DN3317_c0_g4~~TRINITY_DN3317_c0_g4_i1.p1  ORF type:complete len:314 (+),score=35.13 TRINITY_DN3317_c0_g4_i1:380-1321(+)
MSIKKTWDLESAQMLFSSQNRYGCKWMKYKNIPHGKNDRMQKFAVTLSNLADELSTKRGINPNALASEWVQESLKTTRLSTCMSESLSDSEADHVEAIEPAPALNAVVNEALRKSGLTGYEAMLSSVSDPSASFDVPIKLLELPSLECRNESLFCSNVPTNFYEVQTPEPSTVLHHSLNISPLGEEISSSIPESPPSPQHSSPYIQPDSSEEYCFKVCHVVVQREKGAMIMTVQAIMKKVTRKMRIMNCRNLPKENENRRKRRQLKGKNPKNRKKRKSKKETRRDADNNSINILHSSFTVSYTHLTLPTNREV